jgi:pimeloyl-ACP methyl ester carboxylesterase
MTPLVSASYRWTRTRLWVVSFRDSSHPFPEDRNTIDQNSRIFAVVGKWGKAYAIDLLGYGYSDKPSPSKEKPNQIYNFENWAGAILSFHSAALWRLGI